MEEPDAISLKTNGINLNFLLYLTILAIGTSCTDRLTISSPDGNNSMTVIISNEGELFYSVNCRDFMIIKPSRLGFTATDPSLHFEKKLQLVKSEDFSIDETYHLPDGKCSEYINKANEKQFTFRNEGGKKFRLICRAYNDGIAFRYCLSDSGQITIDNEDTKILIPDSTLTWVMNYIPSYETVYSKRLLDTVGAEPLGYPVLLHVKKKRWALITEASVYDQPGTYFSKTGKDNELQILFPQKDFIVNNKWESPWRTIIMGNLEDIVESILVENLNPSSAIENMAWIEPGVTAFPWWWNHLANSYIDTLKAYVDLASEMNWKWIEFDVSLVGSPFLRTSEWEHTSWLSDFTSYAASKGINVYGWDEMNILKSTADRDYLFSRYRDLNIKGIKIDFLNSDKAEVMRFREKALQDAARYHLMVSFHGETIPRGQRRKYPNNMTNEAVLGAEYYTFSWADLPDPVHNCTLPFTRNVVGPMDYTPVTFTIRNENPRKTSYAHELALSIIFESGWLVMADKPAAYLESPARLFLSRLHAAWDEIKFIDGYPGEFTCLARRKGDDWYLAGINAGTSRELEIPLNFLKKGQYQIDLYEDKPGEELTDLITRHKKTNSNDQLLVKMAANGGFASLITRDFHH